MTRQQAEALLDSLIDALDHSRQRDRNDAHQRYFEVRENLIAALTAEDKEAGHGHTSARV